VFPLESKRRTYSCTCILTWNFGRSTLLKAITQNVLDIFSDIILCVFVYFMYIMVINFVINLNRLVHSQITPMV